MIWVNFNQLKMKKIKSSINLTVKFIVFIFVISICNGCYSLSGSSILPAWQTVRIPTFPNFAAYQNPNLSQEFTNQLQDIFTQRTKLTLTNEEDVDLIIEGEITGYQQSSVAIQANEIAGKNRLTVSIRVRYQNNQDESKSFDKTYSAFEDFDGTLTLQQAESGLIDSIIEQIVNLIFNDIAMDW